MIQIFFSHSHRDYELVDKAQNFFETGNQITCWNFRKDTDILGEIPPRVASAIQNSDYFFLFWSKSVAHKIAWVEREFRIAQEIQMNLRNTDDRTPFILIINLDNTPLPPELDGRTIYKNTDFQRLKENILRIGPRQSVTNPLSNSLSAVMTPSDKLLTLSPNDRLIDAFILMETAEVRHLVINNPDGTIAGFMSHRPIRKRIPPKLSEIKKVSEDFDINQYQKAISDAGSLPISSIMTPFHKLIYLEEHHTLEDAIDTLVREYNFGRISAFPVLNGRVTVGIVSYLDLLCKLEIPPLLVGAKKKQNRLFSQSTDTPLNLVYTTMSQANIRHMPILDGDNRLVGLIDDVTVSWLLHPVFGLQNYPVEHFMNPIKRAGFLRDADTFETAIGIFCMDKDTTALPVADDTNGFLGLTGMLSYIDILGSLREST
ncbi:MAG: CBS domain-containing protein [Anaerolineae bacterium]|nr:CBS domain-containing protein [Anaerolineae bacterium]